MSRFTILLHSQQQDYELVHENFVFPINSWKIISCCWFTRLSGFYFISELCSRVDRILI
jgi:hypothetical protein